MSRSISRLSPHALRLDREGKCAAEDGMGENADGGGARRRVWADHARMRARGLGLCAINSFPRGLCK